MLRPESIATEASRVSRADANGAGGTDASPALFAFRRVAITPPDGFANSRRARADLVALRKSVTLSVRRSPIFAHCRRLDPIDRSSRLVGPIDPDGVAALAQAGERGPSSVRQPAGAGDKLGERRAIASLQQFDDPRDLGSAPRRGWGRCDAAISLVNGRRSVRTGFGVRIDGDDRMVRAPFRLSFGGPSLVNRDRLRAGGGQLERISPPSRFVAPPDRRSRLCFYLSDEPGFEKLGYGPLGLGALWTFRRD